MNLEKLLRPESIVIIGATDKPGGFGGGATRNVVKSSIGDRVYYLNPRRDELFGRKCYHSLAELPEVPDCMIMCTPALTIAPYLEEAGQLGIKAAVVFASGFGEERTGQGQAQEAQVREICRRHGIALMGPNCVGYINALDKICGGSSDRGLFKWNVKKGVGLVAQSGYITGGFSSPTPEYLAYVVSAGNCTVCSLEEYMLFFANDDRVNCIAAYIEGVKKPEVFEQALRTAALKRKPVVVLKAGMTEKGSFAAASHTGSLAGDYKTFESIFKKFGVIVTKSLQEFVTTTRMFCVLDGHYPDRPGIGAINFSGGENTLCADTCARYGLDLPEYEQKTVDAIKPLLPSFATPSNPLDATTQLFSETEKVKTLFTSISDDAGIGIITVGNDVGFHSEEKDITCSNVLAELAAEGGLVPCLIVPSFEKTRNDQVREAFEKAGHPVLSTGDLAYAAIRHLCDLAAYDPSAATLELALPSAKPPAGRITLSEFDSKNEIARYGVPVPRQAVAATEAELDKCLTEIPFPVVLKVDSPDIPHKTEAGGVKLSIKTAEEAHAAYGEILANCKAYKPDARINGILVQEMAPAGVEFIIGAKNDRQFGPMLLAGMGGVFVEVFKDVALYPCPLNKQEALAMLAGLKSYKLLEGYRGSGPKDIDALAGLMVKVSEYVVANKDTVAELDLNPVFVYDKGKGAVAADALIVKYQ